MLEYISDDLFYSILNRQILESLSSVSRKLNIRIWKNYDSLTWRNYWELNFFFSLKNVESPNLEMYVRGISILRTCFNKESFELMSKCMRSYRKIASGSGNYELSFNNGKKFREALLKKLILEHCKANILTIFVKEAFHFKKDNVSNILDFCLVHQKLEAFMIIWKMGYQYRKVSKSTKYRNILNDIWNACFKFKPELVKNVTDIILDHKFAADELLMTCSNFIWLKDSNIDFVAHLFERDVRIQKGNNSFRSMLVMLMINFQYTPEYKFDTACKLYPFIESYDIEKFHIMMIGVVDEYTRRLTYIQNKYENNEIVSKSKYFMIKYYQDLKESIHVKSEIMLKNVGVKQREEDMILDIPTREFILDVIPQGEEIY